MTYTLPEEFQPDALHHFLFLWCPCPFGLLFPLCRSHALSSENPFQRSCKMIERSRMHTFSLTCVFVGPVSPCLTLSLSASLSLLTFFWFGSRLATGRVSLIVPGLMLAVALMAIASVDHRRSRRAELEEFVLEPIGQATNSKISSVRQMALLQAYRNSMLW